MPSQVESVEAQYPSALAICPLCPASSKPELIATLAATNPPLTLDQAITAAFNPVAPSATESLIAHGK